LQNNCLNHTAAVPIIVCKSNL